MKLVQRRGGPDPRAPPADQPCVAPWPQHDAPSGGLQRGDALCRRLCLDQNRSTQRSGRSKRCRCPAEEDFSIRTGWNRGTRNEPSCAWTLSCFAPNGLGFGPPDRHGCDTAVARESTSCPARSPGRASAHSPVDGFQLDAAADQRAPRSRPRAPEPIGPEGMVNGRRCGYRWCRRSKRPTVRSTKRSPSGSRACLRRTARTIASISSLAKAAAFAAPTGRRRCCRGCMICPTSTAAPLR